MGQRADEIMDIDQGQSEHASLTAMPETVLPAEASDGTDRHNSVETQDVSAGKEEPSTDVATIHAQIEQTRAEMSETIEAIKAKLSPQHLVEEARQATLETASHAVDESVEFAKAKAHEAVDLARDTVKSTLGGIATASIRFIDLLRENPLPTVATCIAVVGFFSVRARR